MVDTPYPFEIATSRLVLRDYRETDLAAFWEIERDPRVQRYERPVPSYEEVKERVEAIVAQARLDKGGAARHTYRMAVTLIGSTRPIGRMHLSLNIGAIREWEIGWTIHPEHWGRGYATEAALALLDMAFRQVGAHRVIAFCHVDNAASARVMEKIGMQREARLRETVYLDNQWWDELVYGILEREYLRPGPHRVE